MKTLYDYTCPKCLEENNIIEEGEKPGHFAEFRTMDERDSPISCPKCTTSMSRVGIPEGFVATWGNIYNSKKTSLGPSIDYYPPTRERKRKESIRHIDMSPVGEAAKVIKDDAAKAPSAKDLPSPGVSVPKGG